MSDYPTPNWHERGQGLYKAWYDGCVVMLAYGPVDIEEGRRWPQLVDACVLADGVRKSHTRMINGVASSVFEWADTEIVRLSEEGKLYKEIEWEPTKEKHWEPTDGAAQCTYRDRKAELEWQHPVTPDGSLDKTVRWLTLFYDGACYDSEVVPVNRGVYWWAERKLRLMKHQDLLEHIDA